MVKAGAPTDATIAQLEEVFEPGDIIVDGGNSFFKDTIKREKEVRAKGFTSWVAACPVVRKARSTARL